MKVTERPVERWIADESAVEYSQYWNDEDRERSKPWYVLDGDFSKMERYLAQVGLDADLTLAVRTLSERHGRTLSGVGLDLAAGTLWAEPKLLAAGPVERIYALEFSRHRLLKLGPVVLDHYGVGRDSVTLVWGSFYDLRLADASVDFAFMSQAFHHADDPERLLAELRRVLTPGGVVVIIGEHVVPPRAYLTHYAKLALSLLPRRLRARVPPPQRKTLLPSAQDVYLSDEAGDHVYSRREYARMFAASGFRHERFRRRDSIYQGYLLVSG